MTGCPAAGTNGPPSLNFLQTRVDRGLRDARMRPAAALVVTRVTFGACDLSYPRYFLAVKRFLPVLGDIRRLSLAKAGL